MLENTVGKENVTSEKVEYILKQVNNYEKIPADAKLERFRGKAKYRNKCMNNITEAISSLKYETSSDLDMLQKVKLGEDKKTFPTQRAFDAMIKYSDDAITANKRINELDALQAENIKNRAIAKRVITNISTMFATLGVLSVLPKIYARSDTAPGARKMTDEERGFKEVSFKGAKKGNDVLAKMGKKISESKKYDKAASELEYNGHNFTNTLMAGLSLFGLLAPRGLRAYRRAQVDNDTGKKDMTELWEIGLRDVTSSLAVVFAVPMLTRASVTAYEKQSGFVLMHKDRSKSKLATVLDLFNPYSKAHVLKNSEITALYDGIDSQAKMLNFCKYIDKNGGDLQKIISKSENIEEVFNEKTLKLSALKGDKSAKNKEIISFFEKNSGLDNSIKKLMSKVGKGKGNKIATIARGLNSVPGVLTTFFISPYILGWVIPRLTYANTRRIHEKQDRERAEKLSTNA